MFRHLLILALILVPSMLLAQTATERIPFAIWLIPAEPQGKELEDAIWPVADRNQLPRFRPHITLVSSDEGGGLADLEKSLENLLRRVDRFAAKHEPMRLIVKDRTAQSSSDPQQWSTSVYVRLKQEKAVNRFFKDAGKTFGPELIQKKIPGPHLSLAYVKPARAQERERIAGEFGCSVPLSLHVDAIAVVTPRHRPWDRILDQPPGELGDRSEWPVIYFRPLGKRRDRRATPLSMVLMGGQFGVDQQAYRAARDAGLLAFGWMPPGREANPAKELEAKIPPEFLLAATPERNSPRTPDVARSARTALNARDSEGVLIVGKYTGEDSGTLATAAYAHEYGKPIEYADPSKGEAEIKRIVDWLRRNQISVLDVGGRLDIDASKFLHALFRSATEGRPDRDNMKPTQASFARPDCP